MLAPIVNMIGYQKIAAAKSSTADAVTPRNIAAAAREGLIGCNVMTRLGAVPLTKTI